MKNINILHKKIVLASDFFTVSKVHLELKNGAKRIHYNITRRAAVSVFPLTAAHEIYLISQYRYLLDKTIIEAVAGFIDDGEGPLDAAQRELGEETGISASAYTILTTLDVGASVINWKQTLILAKDLTFGDSHPEDSEEITLIKMPLDEAVNKVLKGEITTAATISGILWIDALRKKGKL